MRLMRHCEERSDEAIQAFARRPGLLRFARNDESSDSLRPFRLPKLNIRVLHHLAPALHLLVDKGAEFLRRVRLGVDVELLEARLHVGRLDGVVERAVSVRTIAGEVPCGTNTPFHS